MTTDNSRYEEAAKECASKVLGIPVTEIRDDDTIVYGFVHGASFVEKEKQTEIDELEAMMQHVKSVEKEAHNAAIDKALKLLSEYKLNNVVALVLFEKELEKLKL